LTSGAQDKAEKPLPEGKWNASYVEKPWGLKLKSVKYRFSDKGASALVIFLFEFTKDVEDVKAVRQAFGIMPNRQRSTPTFMLYFFDDENVIFHKTFHRVDTDVEITGKKGDAFRVYLETHRSYLHKATKVEFRPVERPGK
jgi:hypothetical protein